MNCVYTALLGNYETLTEQPIALESSVDFICLTDDPSLTSKTWDVRLIDPVLPLDMVRSQRHLKILGHPYLKEYERSIYIDNTMILTAKPEEIFERYSNTSPLVLPLHSFRETVADEFRVVSRLFLDDPAKIAEQKAFYKKASPHILLQKPYTAGVLIRDHSDENLIKAMEIWEAQVMRYSRRDQLSINFAIELSGVDVFGYEMENYTPWFLTWEKETNRRHDKRYWHEDGFSLKYGIRRATNRARNAVFMARHPDRTAF
jgi:hypothetical protein